MGIKHKETEEWAEDIQSSSPRIYNAITVEIKAAARDFLTHTNRNH